MTQTFPRDSFLSSRCWSSLALLCALLALAALTGCEAPRHRKNVKDLTAEEKRDFVEAVLKLKQTPSPFDKQLSWYDQFVVFHKQVTRASIKEHNQGHHTPAFLPWHRKMLMLYEDALREVSGKNITLPYWDWTDPASTNAVFAEDFMGPSGDGAPCSGSNPDMERCYAVLKGPFRKGEWTINIKPEDPKNLERVGENTTWLVRAQGVNSGNLDETACETASLNAVPDRCAEKYPVSLPTTEDVERCLAVPTFDKAPWNLYVPLNESFRNCLEGFSGVQGDPRQGMHNIGHDWVAGMVLLDSDVLETDAPRDIKIFYGTMEPLETSPNDPVFFLHHANVDRIWAQWEARHPDAYEPNGEGQVGWNPEDTMYPFDQYASVQRMAKHGLTIQSMLSTKALNYEYK
jgi:tyrosinase